MPHSAPASIADTASPLVCHARGTLIETDRGPVPVEALAPGDMVLTRDNGYQPLRWVGARHLDAEALAAMPDLRPIRIREGALGQGYPVRDLVVSPEQGIVFSDWRAELLFGEAEVLAPARALVNDLTITRDTEASTVTYHHFLFAAHQIVTANGVECESFHPAAAMTALDASRRDELLRLFPELCDMAPPRSARMALNWQEAAVLMAV